MSPSKARKSPAQVQCGMSVQLVLYDLGYDSNEYAGRLQSEQRWNELQDQFGSHLVFANAVLPQDFRKSALGMQAHGFLPYEMLWDGSVRKYFKGFVHKLRSKHKYAQKRSSSTCAQVEKALLKLFGSWYTHKATSGRIRDAKIYEALWRSSKVKAANCSNCKLYGMKNIKLRHLDCFMWLDTIWLTLASSLKCTLWFPHSVWAVASLLITFSFETPSNLYCKKFLALGDLETFQSHALLGGLLGYGSWNASKQHSGPHEANFLSFSMSPKLLWVFVAKAAKGSDHPRGFMRFRGLRNCFH